MLNTLVHDLLHFHTEDLTGEIQCRVKDIPFLADMLEKAYNKYDASDFMEWPANERSPIFSTLTQGTTSELQ